MRRAKEINTVEAVPTLGNPSEHRTARHPRMQLGLWLLVVLAVAGMAVGAWLWLRPAPEPQRGSLGTRSL